MNRLLTDTAIRATCCELMQQGRAVSGRTLRRELKRRFNACGKTARVFKIWREEVRASARADEGRAVVIPQDQRQLLERLASAEAAAEQHWQRAERAELREEAHQNRWAAEVDGLRQAALAQPRYADENRRLQDQVLRLTVELHATRRQLADLDPSVGAGNSIE